MKITIDIGEIDSTEVEDNIIRLAGRMADLVNSTQGEFSELLDELALVVLQLKEYKKLYDESSR